MRETAAPMPRVPPVTTATRSAMVSLPNVTVGALYPVLRDFGQETRIHDGLPDNETANVGHRTATMKAFTALLGAAAGTHTADQMALATLPLTATLVLDAGPDILGLLVAAQSAAWLL